MRNSAIEGEKLTIVHEGEVAVDCNGSEASEFTELLAFVCRDGTSRDTKGGIVLCSVSVPAIGGKRSKFYERSNSATFVYVSFCQ